MLRLVVTYFSTGHPSSISKYEVETKRTVSNWDIKETVRVQYFDSLKKWYLQSTGRCDVVCKKCDH